jgi:large subunit ribosomal protein L30
MAKKIKVTLVKSAIKRPQKQKDTIRGLGLRKLNSSSVIEDSIAVRGMLLKVQHLVAVEAIE